MSDPRLHAARAGTHRGWVEFRNSFTNTEDLMGTFLLPIVFLATLYFMRDTEVEGTGGISAAAVSMPGLLAMMVLMGGILSTAGSLAADREDGTLLRAKALPNGMAGYLTSRAVMVILTTAVMMLAVLLPSLVLFDGFTFSATGVATVVWVTVLGLLATMPFGAILGSLFTSARQVGTITMLPLMGLIMASGYFFPVTFLPDWGQTLTQLTPVYWLGLGMRSGMLPDSAAAVEIGESWRHLETVAALGAWTVVGFVIAPIVLRRMARRESGSSVEARKAKAMQRVT